MKMYVKKMHPVIRKSLNENGARDILKTIRRSTELVMKLELVPYFKIKISGIPRSRNENE